MKTLRFLLKPIEKNYIIYVFDCCKNPLSEEVS
jgi:hypothetical protein